MECPKCHASNPDDATFCSLCFEMFKPKAQTAGSASVVIPDAFATFQDWRIDGHLILREDALYFFVSKYTKQEKEGMGSQIAGEFGLVGALIGAAIDSASKKEISAKPDQLAPKKCYEVMDKFQDVLPQAPGLVSCEEFFVLLKKEIENIKFTFSGTMVIKTRYVTIMFGKEAILGGLPKEERERAEGFFLSKGFPIAS